MLDISTLTITSAHEALKSGNFTVRELVDACLSNIDANNDRLNIFLHLFTDIDEQVEAAQKRFEDGTATMLTGIPMSLKANLMRKGQVTNCSSKMLENYRATYTATAVERLEKENVVFLGSTNMDEFAMGASTENSAFGVTKNPIDETRVPGGSSGGSIASVAANMALATLGTDTGGSVRQPASLCGVVGYKGTYGSVSRYGAVAMGSSLDQISPAAKTVEGVRIIWDVMKGNDLYDMTSLPDETWKDQETKEYYKIAIPENFLTVGVDPEVLRIFNEKINALEAAGHTIERISVPELEHALSVYYIVMPAEVSSNLARFDGIRYGAKTVGENLWDEYKKTRADGFGPEVKRRIMLGTYVLSAGYADQYYEKALALREEMKTKMETLFEQFDFVATPTSPVPAFKIGEKSEDPVSMYLADIFTVSANIIGAPAISLPSGTVSVEGKDLPVGVQFMAAPRNDRGLLDFAKETEKN